MPAGSNYVIEILIDAKGEKVSSTVRKVGDDVEQLADRSERAGDRMRQAFTGAALAMTFGKAIPFMRSAIESSNRLTASMTGLRSAVRYTGEDFDAAQAFIEDYIADGLIPLTDASLQLKNMLLAGYGLERSMEIMRALKDFAAYGRQGQLEMGEAVTRATEGLKNEMSTLVDNAGLTKNLSVMWKEYAESIDKGSGSLTQNEKIAATHMGIMREWGAVQGNAVEMADQLSGAMAAQEAKLEMMRAAIGDALAPAYRDLLGQLDPVIDAIKRFGEANPRAIQTLVGGAGLVAAVGALAAAFALIGGPGAIVIGVAAGLIGVATAATALKEKLDPSTDTIERAARRAGDLSERVTELRLEYVELEGKPDKSAVEHERLRNVMEELARLVPEAVAAFGEEGEVLELNVSALKEYVRAMEIVRDMEIEKYEEKVTEAQAERIRIQSELSAKIAAFDAMETHGIKTTKEFTGTIVEGGEEVYSMSEEMVSATITIDDLRRMIRGLAMALREAETEEKRTKRVLAELRGEAEETTDEVAKTTGEVTDLGKTVDKVYSSWLERARELRDLEWGLPELGDYTGEMGEMASYMDAYWGAHERGAEQAEGDLKRLEREFARLGRKWTDWVDLTISSLDMFGEHFVDTLVAMVMGNEAALRSMHEGWEAFFDWLWSEIIRVLIKLLILTVIKAIAGFMGGGDISGDIIGDVPDFGSAQRGGRVRGGVSGRDSVFLRATPGELVTSVGLTNRLESFVADWEDMMTRGFPGLAGGTEEFAFAGAEGAHLHFHTMDYHSYRQAVRNGRLGREILLGLRYGRLRSR